MSATLKLTVEPRTITGRKVKSLRRQNIIPANIFGPGTKSIATQVDHALFDKLYTEAGETSVVELSLAGSNQTTPVLIHQVQRHPVTDAIIHIDFLQVDLKKKIITSIPVEITGIAPAVKDLGGVMVQAINELEIEALPTDIPDALTIDISSLTEIGQSLAVKDIIIPSKVTLLSDSEATLITIQEPQAEEEVATESAEAEEAGANTSESKTEAEEATASEA